MEENPYRSPAEFDYPPDVGPLPPPREVPSGHELVLRALGIVVIFGGMSLLPLLSSGRLEYIVIAIVAIVCGALMVVSAKRRPPP